MQTGRRNRANFADITGHPRPHWAHTGLESDQSSPRAAQARKRGRSNLSGRRHAPTALGKGGDDPEPAPMWWQVGQAIGISMRQIITHGTRRRDTAQPHHSAGHPYTTRSGARRWRSSAAEFVVKKARLLFARRDFPRRHAELIDVPIADDHLDCGQHCLTATHSLSPPIDASRSSGSSCEVTLSQLGASKVRRRFSVCQHYLFRL
jgi:hypothetical protein